MAPQNVPKNFFHAHQLYYPRRVLILIEKWIHLVHHGCQHNMMDNLNLNQFNHFRIDQIDHWYDENHKCPPLSCP